MKDKSQILNRSDVDFDAKNSRINLLRILRQTDRAKVTGSSVSITSKGIDDGFPAVFAHEIVEDNEDEVNKSIHEESWEISRKTEARSYKGRKRRPKTSDRNLVRKIRESIGL